MAARELDVSKVVTFALLAGLCWVSDMPRAEAQTALCPSNIQSFGQSGNNFALSDGACTNGLTGSFSGAALASQALSSLSQTTTQETTRTTIDSITERRKIVQEEQPCPEGLVRVDGACRRPPPVVEAAPPPPVEPAARPARRAAAPALMPARKEAVRPVARVEPRAPVPSAPAPVPVPIEPAVRFGAWTQVFGDYEKRNATGQATVLCCVVNQPPILTPLPLNISVQSRTGTIGFQAGFDLTTRGLISPGDGLLAGVLVGYVSSDLTLNSAAFSTDLAQARNEFARLGATISGPTTGLYATYFDGPFSTDFLFKVDVLELNESFQDSLAFCTCFEPQTSSIVPFSGNGSTNLLNATVAGNLNYRFALYPNLWVEPTVGAQYTSTTYGTSAAALGLSDGSLVMVQGGARFGTVTFINDKVLVTTTLTGLAYSDVLVAGGFIPGAGFAGNNILAQADQGQVRGRGVVAFNADFGNGVKSFIQGEARGGQGLFGAGGKAGVRVEW